MSRSNSALTPAGSLAEALDRLKHEPGRPVRAWVEDLMVEIRTVEDGAEAPADPLFADTAVYAGPGPADIADAHDSYLYGTEE